MRWPNLALSFQFANHTDFNQIPVYADANLRQDGPSNPFYRVSSNSLLCTSKYAKLSVHVRAGQNVLWAS